jgi:hypothetical protein
MTLGLKPLTKNAALQITSKLSLYDAVEAVLSGCE